MYYITKSNQYYEGDRISLHDIECPRRPSVNHTWGGNSWIVNLDKYKMDAVIRIKTMGLGAINMMYPLATGTQTNMLLRQAQITHKRVMNIPLTPNDIEEENTLVAVGNWINLVDSSMDAAVYSIMTASSTEEIDAVTFSLPVTPAPIWS